MVVVCMPIEFLFFIGLLRKKQISLLQEASVVRMIKKTIAT